MTVAPTASVTSSLADVATNLVADLGLAGIFVLMLLDCACIPIPSEVTMMFAGFSVSRGHYSLAAIVIAGTLGNLVGSLIAYAIGHYGSDWVASSRAPRLLRHEHALDRARSWFDRYGSVSVLFARIVPLARTFISLPAGFARMPLGRFTAFTLIGCIPWVVAWAVVGDVVGQNWTQVKDHLQYVDYAVLGLAAAAVAWLLVRWRRGRPHPIG